MSVKWHDEPAERDFPAAQDYLELSFTPEQAAGIVENLRQERTVVKRAKDIIRSSRLPLLPRDNRHVEKNIERAEAGIELSPILLVRGEPLIIADGYHRACAVYYVSEDTEVRCRLADREPSLATRAREAYASGWAATGAPLTERVKAGCVAAVEHALDHADDPDVLEVTLQLGSLEGTWARVYERRDALYAKHTAAIRTAWQAWLSDVDWADLVRQFRDHAGLGEDAADEQRRRRERQLAALALILLLLRRKQAEPDDNYRELTATVIAALRDGEAEGRAGAIAIAAQQLGYTEVDFDAAFDDAQTELADADYFATQAEQVITDIAKGAATDVAKELAALADDTANARRMATAAGNTVDDGKSSDYYSDQAMGRAFSAGALTVYTALGLNTVNFVTAGDTKVCARCAGYEDENPWPLLTVPQPAIHGGCRCSLEPAAPLASLGVFAQYIIGGA